MYNIDSQYVGDSLGFTPGHCIDFTPDIAGCAMWSSLVVIVSRARVGDSSDFNDEEREQSWFRFSFTSYYATNEAPS